MIKVKINPRAFAKIQSNASAVFDQIERRGMKDALMAAAKPIVKETKARTPKRTGALRRSISKKGRTIPAQQTAEVKIGPRSGYRDGKIYPARYAHLVEFGHRQVVNTATGKKNIGFVPPKPFMRPAYESKKDEAREIYGREIGDRIHRQFQRYKRAGKV